MDRLTIRTDTCIEPENDIIFANSADIDGMYNILDLASQSECGDGTESEILLEIANRLAKYEDTGLTPGEIMLYVKCKTNKVPKRELKLGIENDRLKAENAQLRAERDTNTVIHCSDCNHYRAQEIIDGEPNAYVCCRTNGYSPSEKHYCAWAEQSVMPMRWRYTAACTARYVEGETINGIQSEEGKE